jgi:hypothetical protein
VGFRRALASTNQTARNASADVDDRLQTHPRRPVEQAAAPEVNSKCAGKVGAIITVGWG